MAADSSGAGVGGELVALRVDGQRGGGSDFLQAEYRVAVCVCGWGCGGGVAVCARRAAEGGVAACGYGGCGYGGVGGDGGDVGRGELCPLDGCVCSAAAYAGGCIDRCDLSDGVGLLGATVDAGWIFSFAHAIAEVDWRPPDCDAVLMDGVVGAER